MEALLCLLVLFVLSSCLLCLAPEKKYSENELALGIDSLLPQTQCAACGYSGCLPYARAIAAGNADINQCSPGGRATIAAIAALTGQAIKPPSPAHALVKPDQVALIDETLCIGCVKCIQACPVDAIIGAAKQMHTIITSACTGCELCLPPCPVDCIAMVAKEDDARWKWVKPGKAMIIRS